MQHTKVLIIGSGPAGYTAAIYAARANLSPIQLLGSMPGGQLTITTDVENYPGFSKPINGPFLMSQMMEQAKSFNVEMIFENAKTIDFIKRPFIVQTEHGSEISTNSIIIATGAKAKWLGIPGEEEFLGYGVSGCATCDGFFFKNKHVAVIGGGNAAVEEALYLTKHAAKVTLIHRRDVLKAEHIMQDRIFKNEKITFLWNTTVEEFIGNNNPKSLTKLIIKENGILKDFIVDGAFVAIGHQPMSEIATAVTKDSHGYIITKSHSTKTNIEGIFAAGDVMDKKFRQAITAAGFGCMAAIEVLEFLDNS